MGIVPNTKNGANAWGQAHLTPFSTPAPIGMSAAQSTAYIAAANALNASINTANAARNVARAKFELSDSAWATFRAVSAECLAAIKAKAESNDDPTEIYALAEIPSPALPSPAGPPTDVTDVAAHLRNDGTIQITWKGTVRNAQFFTVWRRLSTQAWTQIGSTAKKQFIDGTLTAGTTSATYMVRSQRGDQVSQGSEPVLIVFGTQNMSQAA